MAALKTDRFFIAFLLNIKKNHKQPPLVFSIFYFSGGIATALQCHSIQIIAHAM